MDRPTAAGLEQTTDAALGVLTSALGANWQTPARDLDWTCWETGAHIAHDLLAYASQLSARPADAYLPIDLVVRSGAPASSVLDAVRSCAGLLATALRAAEPEARAWHWGSTDRTGFAALGMNEVLVHTWDITQGLGLSWQPPRSLAALVLQRLFPAAPAGDAGQVLLWCTGRFSLPGHPRQESWILRAACA